MFNDHETKWWTTHGVRNTWTHKILWTIPKNSIHKKSFKNKHRERKGRKKHAEIHQGEKLSPLP